MDESLHEDGNIRGIRDRVFDCCKDKEIMFYDTMTVCIKCGSVHNYSYAKEYIDMYENRYRIKRKSIYQRRYYIINKLNKLDEVHGIKMDHIERGLILKLFSTIDDAIRLMDTNRKRTISIDYMFNKCFQLIGSEHSMKVRRTKKCLERYDIYWNKILDIKKGEFERFVPRN